MAKQLKPHRWWGITYVNSGDVMPDTIRDTQREARKAACRDKDSWDYWYKQGCRVVRVIVTVEPTP